LSNATKFSSYEFSGLDELLAVADKLPVAETKSLAKFPRAAETWRNAGDYKAVFSGDRLWQISGKNYAVVQHAALIKAVVSQLAELGLDSHGRVDTWNEEGRIWITVVSPSEFEPISGDRYRDGVLFANSYDGSTAVSAAYYAWRKVCENGLHAWTKEMAVRKIHVGSSSVRNWVRLAIRRIREQRPEFERLVQRASQERLNEDVNTVLKRFEIGPKVADRLVAKLERTTDPTKYDLANALTSYASHELRTRPLAREKYEDMARRIMVAPTMPSIRRSEAVN
jgi:hypothetical protein